MIGTTRPRVSFFLNNFEGLTSCTAGVEIRSSLLNVLRQYPAMRPLADAGYQTSVV